MRLLLCMALFALSSATYACGSKSGTPVTPVLPDDKAGPIDAPPAKPAPKSEDWAGTLVLPNALVDIVLHFTPASDDKWTATIDVPNQKGLQLSHVTYTADKIQFALEKPDNPRYNETYVFSRQDSAALGKVLLGGQAFHAKLVRLNEGQPPMSVITRPQTLKPPFPYATRDVTIEVAKDASLAGTLTIPEGKGPFPAVLMISGSGQQDRDETVFGHKPFALIADRLARAGIATLRTDDRGVGKTTGAIGTLDTDISDAKAAFEWLVKQPEVDPKRAGILGHSVGGTIAPFVATKSKVAFIVGLAAPGVSGVELVPMQLEIDLNARQLPEKLVKVLVEGQRKVGKAIAAGKEAAVKAALRENFAEAAMAMGAPRPSDAELDKAIADKMDEVKNPWAVSFFKIDPAVAWAKLRIPALLVTGSKDTQVPADINFARIKAAAAKAGNKAITTEKREGLNHLYQHATTGLVDEYGEIEETFDPETLELIAKWVVERTAKR